MKASTPGLPVASKAVFRAASTASAPALARMVTPRSPGASCARRSSRATLIPAGCRSPSAFVSSDAWAESAPATRGFVWPVAATAKPAARST